MWEIVAHVAAYFGFVFVDQSRLHWARPVRAKIGAQRMVERLNVDANQLDTFRDKPFGGLFVEARRIGVVIGIVAVFVVIAGIDHDDVAGLDRRSCRFEVFSGDHFPAFLGNGNDNAGSVEFPKIETGDVMGARQHVQGTVHMRAAKALGANHVTAEHPEDDEHTARLGKIAEEEGILMAYHGHMQQTPTLWDTALAQSSGNSMNLDFGHYIAAENENPLQIIKDKHASIASMHLKDRQKQSNGGGNLMWGTGDTPIAEVVTLIRDNGYTFPITVELEYEIPEGSDAVQEVKRSFEYIKNILKP